MPLVIWEWVVLGERKLYCMQALLSTIQHTNLTPRPPLIGFLWIHLKLYPVDWFGGIKANSNVM